MANPAARTPEPDDPLLDLVRALARQAAREDHDMEIKLHAAAKPDVNTADHPDRRRER